MTAELYTADAPNAVLFMLSWLAPLGGGFGQTRYESGTLPYRQVTRIGTGEDDAYVLADEALVSVHIFGDASTAESRSAALHEADRTHKRMLLMKYDLPEVQMPDGSTACLDFLDVVERPTLRDYKDDRIARYVGRYQYGLTFVAEH